ncbi:hypothetical protein SLEP1_g31954 [Rubroshorea leprosula]|uniref:Uncharacterized protein n=1 Tax=Rubroshorea leprosula TaxID=152421 RepID=A0AAV5KBU0_9ROSI|nr:hypothetical protein SLEP1_g31954 [Rubroshorea leprosula]
MKMIGFCSRFSDDRRDFVFSALDLPPTPNEQLRTYPYRYRAAVLMDDYKEDEAIAELTKVIGFKLDLQLLHLRAAFYDSVGDHESAIRDCEAALCLDPGHSDTLELYNKFCEQMMEGQHILDFASGKVRSKKKEIDTRKASMYIFSLLVMDWMT